MDIVDYGEDKLWFWFSPANDFINYLILVGIGGGVGYIHALCETYRWLDNFVDELLFLKILMITSYFFCALALIKLFKFFVYLFKQWSNINYRVDYVYEKMKKTNLYLWKKKNIERDLLEIKNRIGEKDFSELIKETMKRSKRKRGNAYFYYTLFSEYNYILKEIRNKK